MWDDDLMNFLNGTTTTTESNTENNESNFSAGQTQQTYSPYETQQNQTSYSPSSSQSYSSEYDDDYSVTPNYQEETNYNSASQTDVTNSQTASQEVRYRKMAIPTIEKKEKAVSLTKTKERIYLGARMKIIISVFAVIMFSLAFVSIWNFVSVSKLNSEIADKELVINELTASISGLQSEYNLLSDDEQLVEMAKEAGFVYADETNTYHVSSGTFYEEETVQELPSNWFNEVCEFLSNLFH